MRNIADQAIAGSSYGSDAAMAKPDGNNSRKILSTQYTVVWLWAEKDCECPVMKSAVRQPTSKAFMIASL